MLRAILFIVVVFVFAGCEFDARSDLMCADGETRPGQECVNGFWVNTTPNTNNTNNVNNANNANNANNSNNANNVMDMASDMPDSDMGQDMPDDMEMCVPEADDEFCKRQGLTCDMVTAMDNCMVERTVDCGSCTLPASCGGGGTPNVCGCDAQTDVDFCTANNAECGMVTAMDDCNQMRTVDCGTCTGCTPCNSPDICGGGGTANQCGCTPQSDVDFCTAQNAECGLVSGLDNCGMARTDIDCGGCRGLETCGGAGAANQCGCADDSTLCSGLGATCGAVDVTGQCSNKTSIMCGTCNAPEVCGAVSANQCGCDVNACDGLSCGTLTPNGCSNSVDCGTCGSNQSCDNNVCICDDCSDAACMVGQRCSTMDTTRFCDAGQTCCNPTSDGVLCFQNGIDCGVASITDNCGITRDIDCGGCSGSAVCGLLTPNQCGCDTTACGQFSCGVTRPSGCSNNVDCGGCGSSQTCNGTFDVCVCSDCSDPQCSEGQFCGFGIQCQSDGSCQ